MEVEYEFCIDDKVRTPFGEIGIVSMLGYDESGVVYHVKTANSGQWFKEGQVEPLRIAEY